MSEINQSTSFFDVCVEKITWLMLFVLPILFVPLTSLPLDVGKKYLFFMVLIVALLAWVAGRFREARGTVTLDPILLSFSLVPLIAGISALRSPARMFSLFGTGFDSGTFVFLCALVVSAWLASRYATKTSLPKGYYRWVGFLSIIAVIFQSLRVFLPQLFVKGPFLETTATLLGKWNDLGIFLGLGAILSLFALLDTTIRPLFARVVFVFCLVGLIAVNFFLVWVVVGVVALSLFVYEIAVGVHGSRRFSLPAFLLVATSLIFIFFGAPDRLVGKYVARVGLPSVFEVRPSLSSTLAVANKLPQEQKLLGVGPQRFYIEWLRTKPAEVNETIFWRTEFTEGFGYIPTFIVTTGILGVSAWVLFLVTLLVSGILFFVKRRKEGEAMMPAFMVWFSLVYLWFFSVMYTPDTSLLVFMSLLTGFYSAIVANIYPRKTFSFSVARNHGLGLFFAGVLIVFGAVLPVAGGVLLTRKAYAVTLYRGGLAELRLDNTASAKKKFQRALALDGQEAYLRSLVDVDSAQIRALISSGKGSEGELRDAFRELSNEIITTARRAFDSDPTRYTSLFLLGDAYHVLATARVSGAYEISLGAYQKALELSPSSPEVFLSMARLEIVHGDMAKARQRIADALAKKSDYVEAMLLLSQIEADAGNTAEALATAERATVLAPNDVGSYFQLGLLQYREEEYRSAVASFERAVSLIPSYSNARYFLGLSYDALGRKIDALAQFKEIQRLNPQNAEVAQIIKNITSSRPALTNVAGGAPEEREAPPVEEEVSNE